MSYRDLAFVVLGAVIALSVAFFANETRSKENPGAFLQVANDSNHDVKITAGDSESSWDVATVPPSEYGGMQNADIWPSTRGHVGGYYLLGVEVDGRKTVVSMGRPSTSKRIGGNLIVYKNGDMLIAFEGGGPLQRGLGVPEHLR